MGMAGGFDIITSSDAENINLRALLDAAGFNNDVPTRITYTLNASINVTSAASTGTATPAWQTGTIGSIHTVLIYINGAVKGYGGAGGTGGVGAHGGTGQPGTAGSTGGTSMSFACNATLVVNSGGSVLAGGGGGGGGGGDTSESEGQHLQAQGGAGGLGAGTLAAPDLGQTNGPVVGPTDCDGGTCAEGGNGGKGGAHGAAGSTGESAEGTGGAGGAGGYAVAKNSNTVTVTAASGSTISGTQG